VLINHIHTINVQQWKVVPRNSDSCNRKHFLSVIPAAVHRMQCLIYITHICRARNISTHTRSTQVQTTNTYSRSAFRSFLKIAESDC